MIPHPIAFLEGPAPRSLMALTSKVFFWMKIAAAGAVGIFALAGADALLGTAFSGTATRIFFGCWLLGAGFVIYRELFLSFPALLRQLRNADREEDRGARVRVWGDRTRLGLVEMSVPDVPFEVQVYRLPYPVFPRRLKQSPIRLNPRRVFLLLVGLACGVLVSKAMDSLFTVEMQLLLLLGAGSLYVLFQSAYLSPYFVRIAPGRLETVIFGSFQRKPRFQQRFDLRTCRIDVDLTRWMVTLADKEVSIALLVSLSPERSALCWHMLLGAMSSHPTPELSEDVLYG